MSEVPDCEQGKPLPPNCPLSDPDQITRMSADIAKIKTVICGPPDRPELHYGARLFSVERWQANVSKVLWVLISAVLALIVTNIWSAVTGTGGG